METKISLNKRNRFLQKHKDLFWYMNKSKINEISDEVLVEFILNYGSWEDFLALKKTYGIVNLTEIFIKISTQQKSNLFPKIAHFFNLYFRRYAPQCFK